MFALLSNLIGYPWSADCLIFAICKLSSYSSIYTASYSTLPSLSMDYYSCFLKDYSFTTIEEHFILLIWEPSKGGVLFLSYGELNP
jgi:hypothetical protein